MSQRLLVEASGRPRGLDRLGRIGGDDDVAANCELVRASWMAMLARLFAVGVEDRFDPIDGMEAGAEFRAAARGLPGGFDADDRGPARRRVLQWSWRDPQFVDVPVLAVMRDHGVEQRFVEHLDDLGV